MGQYFILSKIPDYFFFRMEVLRLEFYVCMYLFRKKTERPGLMSHCETYYS